MLGVLPLRKSTAGQVVYLGPFLSDTDGKTPQTALTIANTDIHVLKHNATADVNKNSGGATHIADGRYYATLDATDSNTLGRGEINVSVAGALPIKVPFVVLSAALFDMVFSDGLAIAAFFGAISGITKGTVGIGSTTTGGSTSVVTATCLPVGAVADQFKGQIIVFDKDTITPELRGQKSVINASSNAAAPVLTVTALTTPPVNGDTFTIQ